jgi:predicted O-methyltransferase YrrM
MNEASRSHFFDRYDRFIKNAAAAAGAESELSSVGRLRHRYEALISRNRELFQGARVLDIMSSYGFWSLAALDAGATHVTGIENSEKAVDAAKKAFAEYPFNSESYQFINSDIVSGLRNCDPGAFDLVLCHGFLERSDPRFLFQQLSRLRVKRVILDTRIVQGKGPIIRLRDRAGEAAKSKRAARYASILAVPNHELITFFCDYAQFRWRQIDWKTMSIVDWTGINDYEHDRRRTYVLERSAANVPAAVGRLAGSIPQG